MKILHFICDGYHPDNIVNVIDIEKVSDKYKNKKLVTPYDESRSRLMSLEMWSRIYTGYELQHHKDLYRESHDVKRFFYYDYIDPELFIWDILGRTNSVSQYLTFYAGNWMNLVETDKFTSTESNKKDISGYFMNASSYRRIRYSNGVDTSDSADYLYPTFTRLPTKIVELYGKDRVNKLWDTLRDCDDKTLIHSELRKSTRDAYDFYMDHLVYHRDNILEHLSSIDMHHDNQYIMISNIESDIVYHFLSPYEDIIVDYRSYLTDFLSKLIEMKDPDIVFVHGDHGEEVVDSDSYAVIDNGESRPLVRARDTECPFYMDHMNSIGGYVLAKDMRMVEEFVNNYYTPDGSQKLMDNIREYVIDKLGDRDGRN